MGADVLEAAIRRTVVWFNVHHLSYCLVGGLAVSFRTIERATRDVDLAVGVQSEHHAENLIREIQNIGFTPVELLQRRSNGAISTVRLLSAEFPGVYLDLLLSTCGIENEVITYATPIEILPGLVIPVATIPSLVAMKILSCGYKNRRQDVLDLEHLISDASLSELTQAESLVELMISRGFGAERDLRKVLRDFISEIRS